MKKLAIFVGIFALLLLALVAVAPLAANIDKDVRTTVLIWCGGAGASLLIIAWILWHIEFKGEVYPGESAKNV